MGGFTFFENYKLLNLPLINIFGNSCSFEQQIKRVRLK
jgi:hypothetical protein